MCGDVYSRIVIYTDIVVNNLLFFSEFFLGGAHNNTSQVFLVFFFTFGYFFQNLVGLYICTKGKSFQKRSNIGCKPHFEK